MHWVIQDRSDEPAWDDFITQLDRQSVTYDVVRVVPIAGTMEPDVNPTGLVFACGFASLARTSAAKSWMPGYIDDGLGGDLLAEHWGDLMLNSDAVFSPMRDARPEGTFFIRPLADTKQFAGYVTTGEEFAVWRDKVVALGTDSGATMDGDTVVSYASVKEIYAEYRFFVIGGSVVTGCSYKTGDRVLYSSNVDQRVRDFAQYVADIWSPNRAYCLDIADTPAGLRVIETNSISSSGFYATDMGLFVAAMESEFDD